VKRFYVTSSPDAAPQILRETVEEAIEKARKDVNSGSHERRYIVQIVAVVEPVPQPVQVTWMRDNPNYEAK